MRGLSLCHRAHGDVQARTPTGSVRVGRVADGADAGVEEEIVIEGARPRLPVEARIAPRIRAAVERAGEPVGVDHVEVAVGVAAHAAAGDVAIDARGTATRIVLAGGRGGQLGVALDGAARGVLGARGCRSRHDRQHADGGGQKKLGFHTLGPHAFCLCGSSQPIVTRAMTTVPRMHSPIVKPVLRRADRLIGGRPGAISLPEAQLQRRAPIVQV